MKRQAPKYLTQEEINRLLNAIDNPRDKFLFFLLGYTGLRLSEVKSLNVGSVKNQQILTVNGKGKKIREIPILPELQVKTRTFLDWKRTNGEPIHPKFALFKSTRGKRLSARQIQTLMAKYCKKAGLNRKFSPHSLRHSLGFRLGEKGVSIEVIGEILGHSNLSTTGIYVKPSLKRKEQEMEKLYT